MQNQECNTSCDVQTVPQAIHRQNDTTNSFQNEPAQMVFWKLYKKTGKDDIQKDEDNYALGMHLYNDHHLQNEQQFDDAYSVYILEVCSPRILDMREHMWIHRLC